MLSEERVQAGSRLSIHKQSGFNLARVNHSDEKRLRQVEQESVRDTSRCESSVAPVSDNLIAWENWKLCLRIPRKPTAEDRVLHKQLKDTMVVFEKRVDRKLDAIGVAMLAMKTTRENRVCCTMMERMDKRDEELRKDGEEPELVE